MPAPVSWIIRSPLRSCSARFASTASPPPTRICGRSSTRTPGATRAGSLTGLTSPPSASVGPTWERATPLRTEYERRAALVEIDALVAVWLGMTEEQLIAIYPARYPVLGDYEDVTWFDANGPEARWATGTRSAQARPRSTGSSSRPTWKTRRRTRPRTVTRRRSTRPTGSPSTGRRTPPSPSG